MQDTSGFIRPKTFRKKTQRESEKITPGHPRFIEDPVDDQNWKTTPMVFFCWGLFNEKIVRADPSGFSQTKKTYVFHLMHIVYICTHICVYVHMYIYIYMPPEARTVFQCHTFKVRKNCHSPEELRAGDISCISLEAMHKHAKTFIKPSIVSASKIFKKVSSRSSTQKIGKKNNNTHTHTKKEFFFKSDLNHTPLFFEKQKSYMFQNPPKKNKSPTWLEDSENIQVQVPSPGSVTETLKFHQPFPTPYQPLGR